MLQRSRAGRYSQMEVNRGLPTPLLLKWFRQEGAFWQLDDRIRSMVTFSPLNLAQPWPAMPKWDLVFLRNVMIYFDNDVKKAILGRVARVLAQRRIPAAGRSRNDVQPGRFVLSHRDIEVGLLSTEVRLREPVVLTEKAAAMNDSALSICPPREVLDAFVSAATTALRELTQFEAFPDEVPHAAPARWNANVVSATVALRRQVPGTMLLVVDVDTASQLAARYLPEGTVLTKEIVDDVVGEFSNVIAGQAKTMLKGTPYHFTLSPPVVVRATGLVATHGDASTTLVASLAFAAHRLLLFVELSACAGA